MALVAISPLFSRGVSAIALVMIARFVWRGYLHRSRVRSLKSQGLPILPHSLLFGHLPIFAKFGSIHPPDVNIYVFHTWVVENYREYFPDGHPPPVVYLDLWPFSDSLALVNDPAVASQFTQIKNLPKVAMVKQYIDPLTSGLDIFCTEGQEWKAWRSKLNPGFSVRNLTAIVPDVIQEVVVFANGLEKMAGEDGNWGPVFQLEGRTTNLTFDVICRAVLDMRLHEQSRDKESPLKAALMDQLRLMGIVANVARGRWIGRLPWHWVSVVRNNRTMRNILRPLIQQKLQSGTENLQKSTVVDLAIKVEKDGLGTSNQDLSPKFMDKLIANLKIFLFAGHDTTASAICFTIKLLQDNPQCLKALRAEHDAVLGPDPGKAAEVLTKSPHLLFSLPYTLGVIKETLRLFPLAATIRESHPGFLLTATDSPMKYPMEGFGLWMSSPIIQRHPDHWLRPDEFLPERWTVVEGHPLCPSNKSWMPFSLGPRNCIGMELAVIELKLVLVLTARTLDIKEAWDEWDKKQGHKATPSHMVNGERLYQVGISVVHPKDGMPAHVRLREKSSVTNVD
ncbi:vera protein [Hypoxylon crocopeplum]|nr:vera protein [Hypoxylon crocopeplum]